MYEKRDIQYAQWTKKKAQKFSQQADVLEHQLSQSEEAINTTDQNLHGQIEKYMSIFNFEIKNFLEELVEWKRDLE